MKTILSMSAAMQQAEPLAQHIPATVVTIGRIQAENPTADAISMLVVPRVKVSTPSGLVLSDAMTGDIMTVQLSPKLCADIIAEIALAVIAADAEPAVLTEEPTPPIVTP